MQALRRMGKGKLITANITHLILRCLIILFLVIAASGASFWVMGNKGNSNIIYVLDSSASMTSSDIGSSRFDTSKSLIASLINNAPRGVEYALISFAGVSTIQKTFTEEKAEILLALEQTPISRIGGTDVGGALITATNLFQSRPDEGKTLIIISDGLDNAGSFISGTISEAVEYARQNQVIIHAIAVGTDSGPLGFLPEYYQIPSMFNDEIMILMTEETGGTYHRLETMDELQDIIDELELESERAYVNYNLFFWAPLMVFFLLIMEWIIANTIYRRVL
jgi:Ca-activated chloride channel homolog